MKVAARAEDDVDSGYVARAGGVVEDVKQPAVNDRVEDLTEGVDAERVEYLEAGVDAAFGCLAAGGLDSERSRYRCRGRERLGVQRGSCARPCRSRRREVHR